MSDPTPLAASSAVAEAPHSSAAPSWRVARRVATTLVVAVLAAACVYLWVVDGQWEHRANDLTAISENLGAEVIVEREARTAAESNVASLQGQLDTSTARITELANEEASATDNEAVLVNYLDAMADCADDWAQHASVLKGEYRYTEKTTAQVERELTAYCDGIKVDYATLKAELGR